MGAYASGMVAKALELFSAYRSGSVPPGGGYVVSSFMVDGSAYVRYEIVAYRRARRLSLARDGLTFAAGGNRIFVLVESEGYPDQATEPFLRDARHRCPHRFAELTMVAARNHSRIMVSNAPVVVSAAFTVACPAGLDFAFLFLPGRDARDTIQAFMAATLQQECLVPETAARRAAGAIRAGLARCDVGTRPW